MNAVSHFHGFFLILDRPRFLFFFPTSSSAQNFPGLTVFSSNTVTLTQAPSRIRSSKVGWRREGRTSEHFTLVFGNYHP